MAEEGAQWEVEALALKKQGDTAFGSGDYAAAVTSYTSAISIDDSNHLFYSNRAACYLKLNEKSKALRDGEKCVELKPDWGKGYGRKAAAQFALGRFGPAAETYKEGMRVDPDSAALKQGYTDSKAKEKSAEDAKKAAEEAEKKKEEEEKAAEDDLLGDFFGDIEETVVEQQGKAVKKEMRPQEKFTNQDLGSSAAQIARILQVNFEWKNLNPYNVLQLDIDANEEDVKTRYKKLSTLVHPDKNLGVDNAKDAFDEVKKAYNLLKDEEKQMYTKALVENGRLRGKEVYKKSDKTESEEVIMAKEVMKVFAEIEAQRRQAEKMKLAAKKRERSMNDEEQTKLKEEMKFNKEFKAEGRQQARVDNWRDMANGGKKKKQKKN
ncbi:hypothetical protein TrST_g8447 [Triparma strigata]|uniref:Hsp70-Hsp90 organising protein n=1 Tax=Triparma strigata TaxID=1606541 RepID=A0A9W7AC47_9STRA|nr:hypothetical protein TrST_g8447 [Triparma strigata]|eukprot:CAMPEP_0182508106 /NCGR_PEP_ID=MMETSP1321-20130603/24374_1 /TAXON_ID=91990 /ORGANISM="Bolidomonas sp., Strain RCC1657" /LENGTH=378 /DNA_ID=CAMNT_0024714133 /DNA_START=61 /DNA_END=1197 /DNA_ORIENTATION=+